MVRTQHLLAAAALACGAAEVPAQTAVLLKNINRQSARKVVDDGSAGVPSIGPLNLPATNGVLLSPGTK